MAYIGDLLHKPYQINGRGNPGYDCYGLMLEVEKRYGNILPDFDYKDVNVHNIKKQVAQLINEKRILPVDWLEPAVMIVFRNSFGFSTHVGVYIGNGRFIHTTDKGVAMSPVASYEEKIEGKFKWQK